MPSALLADVAVTIRELQESPSAALTAGEGRPVAILDGNIPAFYAVPADLYARMLDAMEDGELNRLCDERATEPRVPVTLDEL